MSVSGLAGIGLAVALLYVSIVWAASLPLRNASIIDIFWGPGFLVAALTYTLLAHEGYSGRQLLVLVLVAVWGLRLGGYIALRNRGHGEDYRYQRMRENAGANFWWRSLVTVFWLQGILLWIISAPLLVGIHSDSPDEFVITDFAGASVWLAGFLFESVGDFQLARFKADPANHGKVMDRGLWRYTRHPNYFGDALLWWGYFIIAAGTPWGWATIFAPALMTFLLVRVSGVALLERTIKKRRPEYAAYVQRTSAFIPLPPKRPAQ
jgi:steroid 5-alpha reductase family enzyme